MKKATSKVAPVTAALKMGSKRTCIKCKTKFYDFEKAEFSCPKCKTEMTAEDFATSISFAELKKKTAERVVPESLIQDDGPSSSNDVFESVDDLTDDDDDVVEDIDADADDEEDSNY